MFPIRFSHSKQLLMLVLTKALQQLSIKLNHIHLYRYIYMDIHIYTQIQIKLCIPTKHYTQVKLRSLTLDQQSINTHSKKTNIHNHNNSYKDWSHMGGAQLFWSFANISIYTFKKQHMYLHLSICHNMASTCGHSCTPTTCYTRREDGWCAPCGTYKW